MSAPRDTCVDCKHFGFDTGDQGYSNMTPGRNFDMECRKGLWRLRQGDGAYTFRTDMKRAQTCGLFVPVKDQPAVWPSIIDDDNTERY